MKLLQAQAEHERIARFEAAYADRSGGTVEQLHEWGRYAEVCDCGEGSCEGFQMLRTGDLDLPWNRRVKVHRANREAALRRAQALGGNPL